MNESPERTIEELLGWDTAKLLAATPEDLERWLGDALTRQDEMLAKLPAKKAGVARTKMNLPTDAERVAAKIASLPPEFAAIAAKAAAIMKGAKQ